MAYVERKSTTLTTDGTAGVIGYIPSEGFLNGRLANLIYALGTPPFGSTGTVTITVEATSQPVLTLTAISTAGAFYAPRQSIQSTTAGSTTTGDDYIFLANDRLKVVVANATTGTIGTFSAIVG